MTELITRDEPPEEAAGPAVEDPPEADAPEADAPEPGPPSRARRLTGEALAALVALLAYAALAVWLFHDAWADPGTASIQGGSDPGLFGRGSPFGIAVKDVGIGRLPAHTRRPDLRSRLVDDLVRWNVGTVVLGPLPPRDGRPQDREAVAAFLTDLLRRPPERVGGVQVWWNVDPRALPRA